MEIPSRTAPRPSVSIVNNPGNLAPISELGHPLGSRHIRHDGGIYAERLAAPGP